MIDILMFIPPQAQLSISFDDYKRFLEIAKQEEQLRIIKLLETGCERPLDPKWEHYRESCNCWQIELIKGETK